MRDAFGGVFMIKLFIVFIFIYIAFTAVSLNYAKAFRIKNKVIDLIEANEVIGLNEGNFSRYVDNLNIILNQANYNSSCDNYNIPEGEYTSDEGEVVGYCLRGIFIVKESQENHSSDAAEIIKYKVMTSVDWRLGILNKILVLGGKQENSENYIVGSWTITGEATVVKK